MRARKRRESNDGRVKQEEERCRRGAYGETESQPGRERERERSRLD